MNDAMNFMNETMANSTAPEGNMTFALTRSSFEAELGLEDMIMDYSGQNMTLPLEFELPKIQIDVTSYVLDAVFAAVIFFLMIYSFFRKLRLRLSDPSLSINDGPHGDGGNIDVSISIQS